MELPEARAVCWPHLPLLATSLHIQKRGAAAGPLWLNTQHQPGRLRALLSSPGACLVHHGILRGSQVDVPRSLANQEAEAQGVFKWGNVFITYRIIYNQFLFLFVFWDRASLCRPGWCAVPRSELTATSAPLVQAILLPWPPE